MNLLKGVQRCAAIRSGPSIRGGSFFPGDRAGTGNRTPAVFRISPGLWAVRGVIRTCFGRAPLPGRYKGDGKDYVGKFRGRGSLWASVVLVTAVFALPRASANAAETFIANPNPAAGGYTIVGALTTRRPRSICPLLPIRATTLSTGPTEGARSRRTPTIRSRRRRTGIRWPTPKSRSRFTPVTGGAPSREEGPSPPAPP